MKKIGGFFELEIAEGKSLFHDEAIKLSTGRACISLILKTKSYSKIYLPFYCCDALFEPLDLYGIPYEFYKINEQFEICTDIVLKPSEAIIYCNFYGIKSSYVNQLIEKYKEQLIIDNSHAFFIKEYKKNFSFTTARKYFGVPDGAFLYAPNKTIEIDFDRNIEISLSHNLNRLLGKQNQAYKEFLIYEKSLNSKIHLISTVSEKILNTVNFEKVRNIRNENFNFLKNEFQSYNQIHVNNDATDCFCYPLLLNKSIDKEILFNQNIFIPSYWPDVSNRASAGCFELECGLSLELLPLPIDHRYTNEDLTRVSNAIKKMI
jgi:hypothetical protein